MDAQDMERHEIDNCLVHMFDAMDYGEYDRIGESFCDDAHFTFAFSRQDRIDNRMTKDVTGREAIVDFFRQSFAALEQTHHTLSNVASRIAGNRAQTSVHIRAYHKGKGKVGDLFEESLGAAKIELVRDGDAVRIAVFDYTVFIVLGSTDVFAEVEFDA